MKMCGVTVRAAAVLVFGATAPVAAQNLIVRTDPRAEVMAIVFRVAGAPEYSSGAIFRTR